MKTVSLELAKQLKESGYPQLESEFYWWGNREETEIKIAHKSQILVHVIELGIEEKGYCAAPTAEEILELLPKWIKAKGSHHNLTIDWLGDNVAVDYANNNRVMDAVRAFTGNEDDKYLHRVESESIAEAAAKMYLYLVENHLLTKEVQENSEEKGATSEDRRGK